MSTIIQWNIRGLQANREKLQLLLPSLNCDIISLKKTKLNLVISTSISISTSFQNPANDVNGVSHGGDAVLVRNSILPIVTSL